MDKTSYLYKFDIQNGISSLGLATRYYAYKCLVDKTQGAIVGRVWKTELKEDENYECIMPYGSYEISFKGNKLQFVCNKVGGVEEIILRDQLIPSEICIYLIETDEFNLKTPELEKVKQENSEKHLNIIKDFIKEAKLYYDTYIIEIEDKPGKVGIHIFDEYWELLNRHEPRMINTIHLDGIEHQVLEYLKTFKSEKTKKRFIELGMPWKKNLLFEGYPGTGKTSLVFCLASELDCNVAIINFSNKMDDNNFMRAIRRLPKKCILVLDDIDALFKARKDSDEHKNNISFSALLNTLDGLAYRQGMITIMTTNYICNLDPALKRPGRIDKIVNFGLATKGQTKHMFEKFFPENKDNFLEFYKIIKKYKYTTAILQQYFMWHMEEYEKIFENIEEFEELCSKNKYDSSLELYS